MHLDHTPEQKELRREFRAYLNTLMTPERRARIGRGESGVEYKATIRQLGTDGWLTPGWPAEYGGRGFDSMAQKIVLEELVLAEAPFPFVTVNTIGPALIRLGSEEQKKLFLPRIAKGEIIFAIGYTEPSAGTDLAHLKTRAVLQGDHYVVNGNKIFTSGAEGADYVWLACRTDPDAKPHKGISILIMDTKAKGFSVSPIITVGGIRTNVTYYEDVHIPANMVVGEVNGGWRLITEQLNHERVGLSVLTYAGQGCFDEVVKWAKATPAGAAKVIDQPWVQETLGRAYALLAAYSTMGNRVAWEVSQGRIGPAYASAAKVFGTESLIEVYRLLLDVVGPQGIVKQGSPGALLHGKLERGYRECQINTFGGGVAEVMRDMVAQFGMGLPRIAR